MIGELSALFTAVMWSGTSIAFSEASVRIGALQVNINRLFVAMIYLFLTIWLAGFSYELSAAQIGYLSVSGMVGFIFGDTFLFRAFKEIGPRMSMLLMSLAPAIAALLAFVFLEESLSFLDILGMTITIAGIAIVVTERRPDQEQLSPSRQQSDAALPIGTSAPVDSPVMASPYHLHWKGLLYGFLGALGQAVGLILAKAALDIGDINGFVATFVRVASAFVVFLPLAIILKMYRNPITQLRAQPKALGYILIGSFTGPFLGVTGSIISIAHTHVGIASTIMATPPIIMLPLLRLFYKEKFTPKAIVGAIIAVAGVGVLFLV